MKKMKILKWNEEGMQPWREKKASRRRRLQRKMRCKLRRRIDNRRSCYIMKRIYVNIKWLISISEEYDITYQYWQPKPTLTRRRIEGWRKHLLCSWKRRNTAAAKIHRSARWKCGYSGNEEIAYTTICWRPGWLLHRWRSGPHRASTMASETSSSKGPALRGLTVWNVKKLSRLQPTEGFYCLHAGVASHRPAGSRILPWRNSPSRQPAAAKAENRKLLHLLAVRNAGLSISEEKL